MSDAKLPPLDLEEDNKKYEAYHESTEIKFNKCKHDPEIVSGTELRCKKCGSGWMGNNILQLYTLLTTS